MAEVKIFEPTEECRKCRGECCKVMPCHYSPTDFLEITFEYLKAEIDKGRIAIGLIMMLVGSFVIRRKVGTDDHAGN